MRRLPKIAALSVADMLDLFRRKLPPGWLWRHQFAPSGAVYSDGNPVPRTRFGKFCWAIADELANAQARLAKLPIEAYPGTADETLDDWETCLGLPFAGYPTPTTDDDRRAICAAQWLALFNGALSNTYYESLAVPLGVTADVFDTAGKALEITVKSSEFTRMRCNDPCNSALVALTDAGKRYACFVDRYHPAGRRLYWTD